MSDLAPILSIIVATRNRGENLETMLSSLHESVSPVGAGVEIVIADNGSTDGTEAILSRWCTGGPGRTAISVPQKGKARALNAALRIARAPLLAFTDDDVVVPRSWVRAILDIFDQHPNLAAATGRTILPPGNDNPNLLAAVDLYGTLPLFDIGMEKRETTHLYGCNMAVRRSTFQNAGTFDERLGPGASGLHEDGDLAERIRAAGMTILYAPEMLMYHTVDPSRLTEDFFVRLHQADARSRFLQRGPRGIAYAIEHWLGALVMRTLWVVARNPKRAMQARGRMISHRECLRLARAAKKS